MFIGNFLLTVMCSCPNSLFLGKFPQKNFLCHYEVTDWLFALQSCCWRVKQSWWCSRFRKRAALWERDRVTNTLTAGTGRVKKDRGQLNEHLNKQHSFGREGEKRRLLKDVSDPEGQKSHNVSVCSQKQKMESLTKFFRHILETDLEDQNWQKMMEDYVWLWLTSLHELKGLSLCMLSSQGDKCRNSCTVFFLSKPMFVVQILKVFVFVT